jgi:hypothetical protein
MRTGGRHELAAFPTDHGGLSQPGGRNRRQCRASCEQKINGLEGVKIMLGKIAGAIIGNRSQAATVA